MGYTTLLGLVVVEAHHNKELQRLWNQTGKESFTLERCSLAPKVLSPLQLQRWLVKEERKYHEKFKSSGQALNEADPEIVATAEAVKEYQRERIAAEKAHDKAVSEQRRELNVLVPKLKQKSKDKIFTERDEFLVAVPANLKRCGVETKLIVPNGDSSTAHHDSVRAIQEALAKALEWHDALVTGAASSTSAIAKELGVTQRYVGHLLKLAYLAPDIIQAICKGNIPPDLPLSRIKKTLPLDRKEQRKQFGFPA